MKKRFYNMLLSIYKRLPVSEKARMRLKSFFYKLCGNVVKDKPVDVINIDEKKLSEIKDRKIAVQMHLFYVDLLDEFIRYLKNIPCRFDVMVSVTDASHISEIRREISKIENVGVVYIKTVENRGRDVAPLISSFCELLRGYDFICHIHTKKSLYTGGEQTQWRRYLLKGLLGSREQVKKILYLMENENVGLVYPDTFAQIPYWCHTWLKNTGARDNLMERIGVDISEERTYFTYPIGTMFWARRDALQQFFDAGIRTEEFPTESGQNDGTIAHAFERCVSHVVRSNGYDIAIYNHSNTFSRNHSCMNFFKYFSKDENTLWSDISRYDVICFNLFGTLLTSMLYDEPTLVSDALVPRESMIRIYEKAVIEKKVVIIAETQHPKCFVEEILDKFGISGYDKLLVSSSIERSKADGSVWSMVKEAYSGKSVLNVGDDEVNDVQIPDNNSVGYSHVMSCRVLAENSNIYSALKKMGETFDGRIVEGMIVANLYNNPFEYNSSGFKVIISDPYSLGYCILGPSMKGQDQIMSENQFLEFKSAVDGVQHFFDDYRRICHDEYNGEVSFAIEELVKSYDILDDEMRNIYIRLRGE